MLKFCCWLPTQVPVQDLWQANSSGAGPAWHLMGTKYEEYLFRDEALHVPRFVCVGRGEVGGWGFIYVARKNSIYEAVCVFTGELCSQHVLAKQRAQYWYRRRR